MLRRYREAVAGGGTARLGALTALAGAAYFVVWSVAGAAVFALDAALVAVQLPLPAMARAVPVVAGVVVVIAGALQFSAWKARHLACCREAPRRALPARAGAAWRYGLRIGVHCLCCSAGLTAILIVVGVMDLRAMAVVTAAITVERVVPDGERVARGIGVVAVVSGLWLVARAAGLA
jgi:predicted metal-binding membrane protein